ncbi:MAG: ArsR/SmtB family transcription factor [Marmoricola sp.]
MSATSQEKYELPAVLPVASVQEVLAALADPVRLEMVRRMSADGGPVACSQLYDDIGKSTASHHFKVLREAGITERVVIGGQTHQLLRAAELETALPGVVSAVVAAAG